MMRKCHLNTCPVGIATQDPVLRARFTGAPEHVINYLFYVAEEVRELLAELGLRSLGEAVGRTDLLRRANLEREGWKAQGIDLDPLLHRPEPYVGSGAKPEGEASDMRIDDTLAERLDGSQSILVELDIGNEDRSVGAGISGEIVRRMGGKRLPDDGLTVRLTGSAGQSLGAFLVAGVTLDVIGDANDYVGKGLSGGRIVVRQPPGVPREAERNVVVGNTCLYGATAGQAFFNGVGGERFAVRNSGATAVVEGIGDHGCEYMTGGVVVVLGTVGRNFAAGMSGGIAMVHDPDRKLKGGLCNMSGVALEPVEDADLLRRLVEEHARRTHSARASALLDDWDQALDQFVLVMPHEYRRALEAVAIAEAELAA
jgi:glutamate synthase (NADPH/NADH) large chain